MAAVDPDDDAIKRYVVRRYAHDPSRHERRHQVVAAFDSEVEFMTLIRRLSADLERRRVAGDAVDGREHYTGVVLEPGYGRRQRIAHLLRRAARHGATLTDAALEQTDPLQ
jgi:hypothetical protein